jgi:hypothetical protein
VTVDYFTLTGTATAGSDYTTTNGTLTFGPGVTSQSFAIPITDDAVFEASETLGVTLINPTGGATLSGPSSGTVTITDNDAAPTLAISNVTQAEGSATFIFTVTLTGSTSQTATVNYTTADGTAAAPADYAATSGTLTFAPGVTTQTISVTVSGDALNEADETFVVTLSSPSNATITTASGTGTIQNDDAQPSLSIGDVTQAEGNAGPTSFNFVVTLSAASGQTVTASYDNAGDTATTGTDFTPASGTVTFAPGITTQSITGAPTSIDVRYGVIAGAG